MAATHRESFQSPLNVVGLVNLAVIAYTIIKINLFQLVSANNRLGYSMNIYKEGP